MANGALRFNPDDFTIGDMEDFEELSGMSLEDALEEKTTIDPNTGKLVTDERGRPIKSVQMSAKVLKCLIYIIKHREDETFTLDDARNMKVSEIIVEGAEDDAPASAEGNGFSA